MTKNTKRASQVSKQVSKQNMEEMAAANPEVAREMEKIESIRVQTEQRLKEHEKRIEDLDRTTAMMEMKMEQLEKLRLETEQRHEEYKRKIEKIEERVETEQRLKKHEQRIEDLDRTTAMMEMKMEQLEKLRFETEQRQKENKRKIEKIEERVETEQRLKEHERKIEDLDRTTAMMEMKMEQLEKLRLEMEQRQEEFERRLSCTNPLLNPQVGLRLQRREEDRKNVEMEQKHYEKTADPESDKPWMNGDFLLENAIQLEHEQDEWRGTDIEKEKAKEEGQKMGGEEENRKFEVEEEKTKVKEEEKNLKMPQYASDSDDSWMDEGEEKRMKEEDDMTKFAQEMGKILTTPPSNTHYCKGGTSSEDWWMDKKENRQPQEEDQWGYTQPGSWAEGKTTEEYKDPFLSRWVRKTNIEKEEKNEMYASDSDDSWVDEDEEKRMRAEDEMRKFKQKMGKRWKSPPSDKYASDSDDSWTDEGEEKIVQVGIESTQKKAQEEEKEEIKEKEEETIRKRDREGQRGHRSTQPGSSTETKTNTWKSLLKWGKNKDIQEVDLEMEEEEERKRQLAENDKNLKKLQGEAETEHTQLGSRVKVKTEKKKKGKSLSKWLNKREKATEEEKAKEEESTMREEEMRKEEESTMREEEMRKEEESTMREEEMRKIVEDPSDSKTLPGNRNDCNGATVSGDLWMDEKEKTQQVVEVKSTLTNPHVGGQDGNFLARSSAEAMTAEKKNKSLLRWGKKKDIGEVEKEKAKRKERNMVIPLYVSDSDDSQMDEAEQRKRQLVEIENNLKKLQDVSEAKEKKKKRKSLVKWVKKRLGFGTTK